MSPTTSVTAGDDDPGLDVTLAALADPVRRRVVEVLGNGPRRSGELAQLVGVSPATMSKHLRVLHQGGLVNRADDNFDTRLRIYSLRSAPMADLRRWLADAEQGWTEQLGAFVDHLERGDDAHVADGSRR